MKDRVLAGFISGVLAAIGADIVNWILFSLQFAETRFLDWAALIFLGHLPANLAETIVTQITQMVWDGLMGVVFIMLIPIIDSDHIIFKGIMFAFSLLLVFRGITVLFNVPHLNDLPLATFLSNVLCSMVWGLLAALFIKRFSQRVY